MRVTTGSKRSDEPLYGGCYRLLGKYIHGIFVSGILLVAERVGDIGFEACIIII